MMRSFGAPTSCQKCSGFVVGLERVAGRDFRAVENGEVEFFFRDAVPIRRGDQLPGEGDGVLLEIIAERKVSEHFEEGVVAVGEADVFQVVVLAAGAHAFLAGGGAIVVALFEAQEDVLELVHPGVGEEQRRIVRRDERRAAHDAVAALFEEFQKCCTNLVAGPLGVSQGCPLSKRTIIAEGHNPSNAARRRVSPNHSARDKIRKVQLY